MKHLAADFYSFSQSSGTLFPSAHKYARGRWMRVTRAEVGDRARLRRSAVRTAAAAAAAHPYITSPPSTDAWNTDPLGYNHCLCFVFFFPPLASVSLFFTCHGSLFCVTAAAVHEVVPRAGESPPPWPQKTLAAGIQPSAAATDFHQTTARLPAAHECRRSRAALHVRGRGMKCHITQCFFFCFFFVVV